MNIFVLHEDPQIAATMQCDKHIPKMVVEAAQMLSTAHRMLDGREDKRPSKSGKRMVKYYYLDDPVAEEVYMKAVHFYHPCTVWTMESSDNYQWHWEHLKALCEEYTYRYGKTHKVHAERLEALKKIPTNIPHIGLTPFKQAMNHYPMCKDPDPVTAYRNYYHAAKSFAKWEKGRPAPDWWKGYQGADLYTA